MVSYCIVWWRELIGHAALGGQVGNDAYGRDLRHTLDSFGVETEFVGQSEVDATGFANILNDWPFAEQDKMANNKAQIFLKGANDALDESDVFAAFRKLGSMAAGGVVCLQLESRDAVNLAALQQAPRPHHAHEAIILA